jgi:hypothetical protein
MSSLLGAATESIVFALGVVSVDEYMAGKLSWPRRPGRYLKVRSDCKILYKGAIDLEDD